MSATADAQEIRNVVAVDVYEKKDVTLKLMFDPDHSLEQSILDEQFLSLRASVRTNADAGRRW